MYWTTKSGHKLLIKNMSSDHIRNTLRMLEKQKTSITAIGGTDIDEFDYFEEDIRSTSTYKGLYDELVRRVIGLSEEPLIGNTRAKGRFGK